MATMSPRTDLVEEIATLSGGCLRVVDLLTGWPAVAEIASPEGRQMVSLHVGNVGLTHRGRDAVERRYQNPTSLDPIKALPGTRPLLLGLWKEMAVPVLVAHDAQLRVGQGGTRVSLFVGLGALRAAATSGWGQHTSADGERIVTFSAALFPVFAEMFLHETTPPIGETQRVLQAAEVSLGDPASIERGRRATNVLIRDVKFRRNVVGAYDGSCAMCGLALGIVEGAHIHPASAPGSSDEVTNGLALCPNHHAAFDRHMVWVEPGSLRILLHPELVAAVAGSTAAKAFVEATLPSLRLPRSTAACPSDSSLTARYAFFDDAYAWVDP